MKYPHRRYLQFLLSKGYRLPDIAADCASRGLLLPNDDSMQVLSEEMGAPPAKPSGGIANKKFKAWVKKLGLLSMWEETQEAVTARDLMFHPRIRNEIQTLQLAHWNPKLVHEQLVLNHPPHLVPELEVVEAFIYYFWDFVGMSAEDIYNFLEVIDDTHGSLTPAVDGDMALAYARMGFRQEIQELDFHSDLIALASYQINLARRKGDDLNGSRLAGIAALGRVAQESLHDMRDLREGGTGSSIIEQVKKFRLARKKRTQPILSMDDIAHDNEEVDLEKYPNVRKLPLHD